jgi:galactokinase
MIGGGYGGSAIALIKEEDSARIQSKIKAEFLEQGFIEPHFFTALPSDGARIIQRG